ncbi:hypothetical protein ABH935_010054 [Catenulispora sp. GAS73]|uniref:hypothetical protein n=1 Tax=Catenulispora sp. GAS73 TaxID=3156269 RepID=UPI003518BDD2
MLALFADLRVEDATAGVGSAPTTPLQFGVYVSAESEKSLDALLGGFASAGSPSWQLQIEANYRGQDGLELPGDNVPGVAQAEFSFGPPPSGLLGYTAIGLTEDSMDGTLPNAVDIVFMFPDGALSGPSETCAEWDVAGTKYSIAGTIFAGGHGFPDILLCHIPAISVFTSLKVTAFGMVPVKSLVPSSVGTSAISVTNPRILETTSFQDRPGAIPKGLMYGLGQEYELYLQPPSGSKFTDIEPGSTGIGLRSREIQMSPGGSMAASMVDSRRHNVIDILQQALLLLSGTLFGLVPAVLPFAAKARRGPQDPAKWQDPAKQPAPAIESDAGESG